MKKKLDKHKKIFIFLTILIIVAIPVSIFSNSMKKKQEMALEAMNQQETALLERRTLVSSVSATGVITSVESKDLSVNLTGVEVEEVMVEVGDMVSAGDTLCIFDSEDIENSLADAQLSLNVTTSKSQIDVASSERSLSEAVESRDIDLARNSDDVADALSDYQEALNDVEDAEEAYEDAEDTTDEYESQLNELNSKKESLESKMSTHTKRFNDARDAIKKYVKENGAILKEGFANLTIEGVIPDSASDVYEFPTDMSSNGEGVNDNVETVSDNDIPVDEQVAVSNNISPASINESTITNYLNTMKEAQTSYSAKKTEFTNVTTQITTVQKEYETAKQTESSLKSAYDSAVTSVDGKYDTYEQKIHNQEDAVRSNESTIANKTDSVNTSKLNASTSGMSDKNQIEQYEEQLENCTVTAPISGVITAVNVDSGNTYNGTTLFTIEDNSAYEVSAEINEYDIGKVALGQKVVIKTNGTGDEELEGTVKKIAPRATVGGTEVAYNVRISIDTPNNLLRMDMTAKLSIILESRENVLTVPYEAVMEDENGTYYIEVIKQNQPVDNEEADVKKENDKSSSLQAEKIMVEKGIESDYYIEVLSDSLQEGMEVVVPKISEGGIGIQEMLQQQGPMGGF